jgi:hypothetical protein
LSNQPPMPARYDPLADLHLRYPSWRLNFTDDPTAPAISFRIHNVILVSLCSTECPELILARVVARLDVCHNDMAVITDKLRRRAEELALRRLNRLSSETSSGRVVSDSQTG